MFFHNGQMKSLRDVIRFYNTRDTNPELWYPAVNGVVQKFDDLPPQYRDNIDPQPPLDGRLRGSPPAMSDQDMDDLEVFIRTLTDDDALGNIVEGRMTAVGKESAAQSRLLLQPPRVH